MKIKEYDVYRKSSPEYEPVELEALGDDEIIKAIDSFNTDLIFDPSEYIPELKAISQATIKHNQSKYGKLFRVKEGK